MKLYFITLAPYLHTYIYRTCGSSYNKMLFGANEDSSWSCVPLCPLLHHGAALNHLGPYSQVPHILTIQSTISAHSPILPTTPQLLSR